MPKEQYMCQLCANHGIFNQPKKGHKQKCPYRTCPCSLCALNTKRRALDQIERQLKHTNEHASQQPHHSQECQTSPKNQSPSLSSPTQNGNGNGINDGGFQRSSYTLNNGAFTIQLPATMTRKELKILRREDIPQSLKRPFIENSIDSIKKHKSIFHSAEMLATSPQSSL
ncbi:unnamed protein product [Caenorhabditis angaria]|uniref:DM domain-containing protein n=1 Tax=Caenorhabditis angaria TaxID=860376 RepID=A0A9P1N8E0_9PELO|nr:unnamed protein product [Caenorhabditis angaria]